MPLETQLNNLEDLRLPELQACYKQVVGKATRAPNRKFLMRKIREAAAAQAAAESPTKAKSSCPLPGLGFVVFDAGPPATPKRTAHKGGTKPSAAKPELKKPPKPTPTQKTKKAPLRVAPPAPEPAPESEAATTTTAPPRPDLKALSVNDLRTAYVEEVGRPTKRTDRNYLIWKIGQARKGKVAVGPSTRSATAGERRVLPLRMHADTIDALDDVWRRHSLSSRMDMFRCALRLYLTSLDEHEAAALVR